jgi:threonine dehydratase
LQWAMELGEEVRRVIAFSTGNHAAAVAKAAAEQGLPATIYMPESVNPSKYENTAQYGADIVLKPSLEAGGAAAAAHGEQEGALFIHPYDMKDVVATQAMMTILLRWQLAALGIDPDNPRLALHAPVGGGGFAASTAVSSRVHLPNSSFHVVQAVNANAAVAMLGGKPFNPNMFDTTVDGAAVLQPGKIGMAVLRDLVDKHHAHMATLGQYGEATAVGARALHTRRVSDGEVHTGSISGVPEPAAAGPIASALAVARAAEERRKADGTEPESTIHVAMVTGINTTPDKVGKLAWHAYTEPRNPRHPENGGWLNDAQFRELVDAGNLGRRRAPTPSEERALAAARQVPKQFRSGSRVASGK